MITSIVAAVVIFAILIVVHEAGHFAMAKRLGVRVLRFSVGYPPRLFGIRYGETDYSLGATPFGGYVKMLGDEVAEEPSSATLLGYIKELLLDLEEAARHTKWIARDTPDEDTIKAIAGELAGGYEASRAVASGSADGAVIGVGAAPAARAQTVLGRDLKPEELIVLQAIERAGSVSRACEILSEGKPSALVEQYNSRAFPSQSLAKRFAIVLAGPASNIIFAPILMAVVFMVGVSTMLPVLGSIPKNLPGYAAGLQPGDRVVAVNSSPINTWDELSTLVKQSGGNPIKLTVERKGAAASAASTLNLTVAPKRVDEPTIYGTKAPTWVIGVTPRGDAITHREGPIAALGDAVTESVSMAGTLMVGIAKIISGATPVRQALGGPIMIAQIAGREVHQGFSDVAMFTVMLSLELGIINLFPVPLLDGGHLMFFVIEGVRGEPMKLRHREIAMQVGLFLLAILMAFVIVNDISRLIG
jgi:regulator of sigma E protease